MASGCTVTSKICMIIVGITFWGAAATLCFVGSWVYSTYSHFDELTEASLTLVPASIIIAGGIFMFIIGLLGCIAACKESKCLLAIFFSLILVVFMAEVTAGIMGYVYRHEVKQTVSDGLTNSINRYNETLQKTQLDYVQQELHCCGIQNASDWSHSISWGHEHPNQVPTSCCRNETCTMNGTLVPRDPAIFKDGCLSLLENKLNTNLVYIAGIAVAFAVIQILGLICACILLCRSQEVRYETLVGAERNGLRV
ncbi:tetraspanin-3 [Patella vulgata]|uniref:tetraspanin-3 n=1 Tax=Patella vulgata TaxID=6465 RepID=UPI00217F4E03|nr:tetraspanin-3 [Patella vulgata]